VSSISLDYFPGESVESGIEDSRVPIVLSEDAARSKETVLVRALDRRNQPDVRTPGPKAGG